MKLIPHHYSKISWVFLHAYGTDPSPALGEHGYPIPEVPRELFLSLVCDKHGCRLHVLPQRLIPFPLIIFLQYSRTAVPKLWATAHLWAVERYSQVKVRGKES
ncbi:hypothetical protein AVEN_127278-1 [Araneus ventricosus]|uniref:Uncharacterized protein n=1 Tax=Araneus ventricosus TaxID=182803 RepID=A0A4Y2W7Y5_ARAVE|nr:hypothetical protein AVEN_71283-1 [Araneus ventricosus]GBO33516.1 hypothetical protein AVEN_127278-1 [Araneus ventricosus]